MTQPRDIDLGEWLNGVGFHPANTSLKQLGHEAVRQQIARLGTTLHAVLPPGRDKSLVFTLLEDVLMRANRALAIGGGPNPDLVSEQALNTLIENGPLAADPRIESYKAEQRGDETPGGLRGIESGEAWGTPTVRQ